MAIHNTTLYPPIIPYSIPGFALEDVNGEGLDVSKNVRIYFALSSYNTRKDFNSAQVIVKYQVSNANALNINRYPSQIKECVVQEVTPDEDPVIANTQSKYYIELDKTDLETGEFLEETVYKVQIRLSTTEANSEQHGNSWYKDHLKDFSEWSTVCCIKGILKPDYYIKNLENEDIDYVDEDVERIITSVDSIFTLVYSTPRSSEVLKQYRLYLCDSSDQNILADSGWKTYDNYNTNLKEYENNAMAIEVILPYAMEEETHYNLHVGIITKSDYKDETKIAFRTSSLSASSVVPGTIEALIDEDEGYAKVKVLGNTVEDIMSNMILRRTSSETNFTVWEDICFFTVNNEPLDFEYYDATIESGIYYRYGVQFCDVYGRRGSLLLSTPVMGEFDNAFLVETSGEYKNLKTLKIQYDFKITNFTPTISEAKTDTIGSKFPFVRRNGNMDYKVLECSGLITAFMDNNNSFTSPKELYHGNEEKYEEVRKAIDKVVNNYDYTYEKEFRENVIKFLTNDKPKIFKSLQEGNILIKIMNVSLTPREGLGRLLYDFSATFVEIDEASLSNFDRYGILKIGTFNPNLRHGESKFCRISLSSKDWKDNSEKNIMDDIKDYFHYKESINNNIVDSFNLTYLRLEFESDPYLIYEDKNGLYPVEFTDVWEDPKVPTHSLILGWLIEIDKKRILIEAPNNIYELKGDNISFSQNSEIKIIVPKKNESITDNKHKDEKDLIKVQFDCVGQLFIKIDTGKIARKIIYSSIVGQIIKKFKTDEDISRSIWYKYYRNYFGSNRKVEGIDNNDESFYQNVSLLSVDLEAEPGTIISTRSNIKKDLTKFIVGETGLIHLEPGVNGLKIDELRIDGFRLDARYVFSKYNTKETWEDATKSHRSESEVFVEPESYEESSLKYFNDIHNKGSIRIDNPITYDYYTNNGFSWMYYDGEWRSTKIIKINNQNVIFEIDTPMDAMVFYYLQAEKGIY